MRITCPSCNAHYEIGDDLIHPEGRDVQCSNCGTTWFQKRSQLAVPVKARDGADGDDGTQGLEDDGREDDGGEDDGGEDMEDDAPAPRRGGADKAALDILREERAREDRLRAAAQSDAGTGEPPIAPPSPREAAAAERVRMAAAATLARARDGHRAAPRDDAAPPVDSPGKASEAAARKRPGGTSPVPHAEPAGEDAPPAAEQVPPVEAAFRHGRIARLQLLPDIEEINSSLRPDDRDAAGGNISAAEGRAPDPAARAGFRRGFLGACAVALALVAAYAFAEPIGRGVPALAEPLGRYVVWVDGWRAGFERAVEALTERIAPEP